MPAKQVAPYGTWPSPLAPEGLARAKLRLSEVRLGAGLVHWIEGRPEEGGRNVVVRLEEDGSRRDLVAQGFDARTHVHEYGGGSYAVGEDGRLWFCNLADQRIWTTSDGEKPEAVTAAGALAYADLRLDAARDRLLCIREDSSGAAEPRAALVSVALASGEVATLAEGEDFYASPALSPDGRRLAWLTWSHPDMPWDATSLMLAEVREDGSLRDAVRIAGGAGESVFQPRWSPGGDLWFCSDRSGFWNLYRTTDGAFLEVTDLEAEVGLPQWVFGMSVWAFAGGAGVVFAACHEGEWRLHRLDGARLLDYELPFGEIRDVQSDGRSAYFVGGASDRPTAVVAMDLESGSWEVVAERSAGDLPTESLSRPQAITAPTSGGATTRAFFYPPTSATHGGPRDEAPPLLVLSHGGPTAAATTALNLEVQFWTSRGFAVADVNYRGSTGFGRAYREALAGGWGVVDVDDCCAVARALAAEGRVDGRRLVIRGGSAGGFTTLAALAFRDVFEAGASYYGIGDLGTLARDTHKFESRYLERLVGGTPAAAPDLYRERSPLFAADRLSCPVIFLQGLEDRVVPPSQAEAMVAALREKGVAVAYVAFAGEQHGFRRAESIARALAAELWFYGRVLGFDASAPPDGVEVWNLPSAPSGQDV